VHLLIWETIGPDVSGLPPTPRLLVRDGNHANGRLERALDGWLNFLGGTYLLALSSLA
jgi:hypothetical protein